MAYKFNGGRGGVICDACRKMIDQDLSPQEYDATWGVKKGEEGDLCMVCRGRLAESGLRHTLGEREGVTAPGVRIPHLPPEEDSDFVVLPIPGSDGEQEPEMSDEEMKARYEVVKEDTTCWRCVDNATCKYAWDPYNTDGDCLADK